MKPPFPTKAKLEFPASSFNWEVQHGYANPADLEDFDKIFPIEIILHSDVTEKKKLFTYDLSNDAGDHYSADSGAFRLTVSDSYLRHGRPSKIKRKLSATHLLGESFVFTGALESMTREQAAQKVSALGGRVSGTASRGVTFAVVGKKPGSKHQRAINAGCQLLTEAEFLKKIGE